MKKKSFGAWVLKLVTTVVMYVLLLVIRILRSPVTLLEELGDEKGPIFAPSVRKVSKEDFESPSEFTSFLKAKVKEVGNQRLGGILFAIWKTVLRILKSPADGLDDFYDHIEDPNYDPTNLRLLSKNFFTRARRVWAQKTLIGRVAHRMSHRPKSISRGPSENKQEQTEEISFHPENLSHPGDGEMKIYAVGTLPTVFLCINFLINCQTESNEE